MNHRGGVALIRATWASWLQARGFFFVLAFLWMIPPLVSLFVWLAAAGDGQVGGMSRGVFVAYYLIVILVNQLTYSQSNWTVGDYVRYGGLTVWLLRPIPPLYTLLASEVAGKVVYMTFVIPISALLALVLRPELHLNSRQVFLFMPALSLAWALRYFWGLWLAELAFWATRADSLLVIQDSLVFLLAGVVAPVALLPQGMAHLAGLLPFRYMVGFPVEVLIGQLTVEEALQGMSIQCAWLAVSVGLSWFMWVKGVKRYVAVGG